MKGRGDSAGEAVSGLFFCRVCKYFGFGWYIGNLIPVCFSDSVDRFIHLFELVYLSGEVSKSVVLLLGYSTYLGTYYHHHHRLLLGNYPEETLTTHQPTNQPSKKNHEIQRSRRHLHPRTLHLLPLPHLRNIHLHPPWLHAQLRLDLHAHPLLDPYYRRVLSISDVS